MWADKRSKLMSEDPINANDLRDILYTLFTDDTTPTDLGAGAKLTPTNLPPLQIGNVDPNTPLISGVRRDGSPFSLFLGPDGTLGPQEAAPSLAVGSGGAFPGKILSGTGANYVVEIYPQGAIDSAFSRTVNVTQLKINPDKQIPAGEFVIVVKSGNFYFMQFPTWA